MLKTSAVFDSLESKIANDDKFAALQDLAEYFTAQQQYHHLFEALKMQARLKLGLPITFNQPIDSLPLGIRQQFDQLLLDACQAVGKLFWESGRIAEGWTYLQPCPDRDVVCDYFNRIEITDENIEEFIGIGIGESLNPEGGYRLVLDRFGTCNAITSYDSHAPQLAPQHQQAMATLLVNHFYKELTSNLAEVIFREEGTRTSEESLSELIADRDWLFSGGAYHIDTTHLASVVRIGRIIGEKTIIKKLVELCGYGMSLDTGLQFEGEPPFLDYYQDHELFYNALSGTDIEKATTHFESQLSKLDVEQLGTPPFWEFVFWFENLGLENKAIDLILNVGLLRFGHVDWPAMMEVARKANRTEEIAKFCQENEDLLGFTIARIEND